MANKNFKTDITAEGDVSGRYLKSTNSSGDEGGEILLAKPVTNTTIAGTGVTVDVWQNRLRFFEQGGDARGYYIDITGGSAGVGTNLVGSGGGGVASNSFATISVSGQDNVAADSSTDILTLIAGSNVTITTNATNDSITIASTDTNTTYSISAETATGGANVRLTNSSAATDDVKIAAGTNMTVTRTDANTITLDSTGNYTSVDSITYPDYITFDTTPETVPTATGSLYWDSGDGLPATVLNANVTIGLGQEQVALVKNATGASIAKGKVVYINGAQGQRPTITLSDADTEVTSSKTFGLTAESIADEAEGFVTTFGVLRGVNTLGLTEGAALWLSSTVGGYTTTVPAEPAHSVFLGYVVKAHETAGEIFVNIQNGYELTELHGVVIENGESLTDNEVLAYDTTSGLWKNQTAIEANIATRQGWTHDSGITIQSSSGSAGSLSLKSFSSTIDILDTSVNIVSGVDAKTWNFQNDGDLVFPDTTVQNTAFLGMASYSTTNLSEGTNLYFTDERAQDAVGNNVGTGLSYNDSTGAISNSGVIDLTGTTNEIVVSASTGSITIGIPDSPVLVTPNIGVATATSVNGTTIPSSKTLVITDDIGSTVQGYSSTLAGINTLGSGTGFLKNTAGTWSYDNSTYLTTSDASSTYLTQSNASSTYLTQSNASSTYQPLDQDLTDIAALTGNGFLKKTAGVWGMDTSTYLTSYTETDTLETVTDRGASSTNAITISNTTQSTTPTSGALIVSGGVGIAKDVWIDGDLHVNGTTSTTYSTTVATHDNLIYLNQSQDATITNAVGDGTYVTYTADNDYTVGMDIRVTGMDPAGYNISSADGLTIYSATATQFVVAKTTTGTFVSGGTAHAKTEANADLGFAGGYYSGSYAHAGLFRDASDGVFKFFDGYTPEPDEAVDIDTAHASFSFASIKADSLDVVDKSATRTNLGLAIGTDVQAYNATLAAVAGGTYTGDDSISTVGTITSGAWAGTAITNSYISDALTISGGTINDTPIGATTPSSGKFTSVNVNSKALVETFSATGNSSSQSIDSIIDETIYTGAEYIISVKTDTGRYLSKALLICDGTNSIQVTEYGILTIGTAPSVTVASGGSASSPRLSVNAPTGSSITLVRTLVAF